jgi:hypothetical protein
MEKTKTSRLDLIPQIGLITAIAYGVGSVIGSGIFKKPGLMAAQLGSPVLLIIVWLVTGLMTLFGALSIAEIASIFPRSGGLYIYFTECYNRLTGYLYGWAVFIVIQTGSIASIAYVFSDSLGYFFNFFRLPASWEAIAIHIPFLGVITPFMFFGLKLCTIGLVLFLTFINYLAVRLGGALQVIFTALKIGALLSIVAFAFLFGSGNFDNFTTSSLPLKTGDGSMFLAFIVAMSGAFWVYDGWINVTYSAGEIKNSKKKPSKNLVLFCPHLYLDISSDKSGLHLHHTSPRDGPKICFSGGIRAGISRRNGCRRQFLGKMGGSYHRPCDKRFNFRDCQWDDNALGEGLFRNGAGRIVPKADRGSPSPVPHTSQVIIYPGNLDFFIGHVRNIRSANRHVDFCFMDILCSGSVGRDRTAKENAGRTADLSGLGLPCVTGSIHHFFTRISRIHTLQ